jgi:hypothetical protein
VARPVRPRVLVCLNSLELGGTQINAVDLSDRVRGWGFQPHLVGWAGPRMGLLHLVKDRYLSVRVLERPETSFGRARALAEQVHRVQPHIVHVYGGVDARAGFWGAARFGRVPLLLTVYEMQMPPRFYRSPGLVVGTTYLAEEERDRRGPTVLISPPVDTWRDRSGAVREMDLSPWGVAEDTVRLVMVTRVDEAMKARHIEVAIDAVARLPGNVSLLVVGTGDALPRLQRRAAAVNEDIGRPAVHFVGELADPRPAYAAADVVLGMGSSAARGLAFGKPLVVIGEYGVPELFSPETSEQLFRRSFWSAEPPTSGTAALHNVLLPLMGNSELRSSLGSFGRSFAEERFSLDRMSERLAGLYGSMLPGGTWRADWLRDAAHDLGNGPRLLRTHVVPRVLPRGRVVSRRNPA